MSERIHLEGLKYLVDPITGKLFQVSIDVNDMGDLAQNIARLLPKPAVPVHNLGPAQDAIGMEPVHGIYTPSGNPGIYTVTMLSELPSVPRLSLNLQLEASGRYLVASGKHNFKKTDVPPGNLVITDPWLPPKGMKLYFIATAFIMTSHKDPFEVQAIDTGSVYLIARIKDQFYAPFIPNIFNNGKCCLGATNIGRNTSNKKSLPALYTQVRANYFDTDFNDHLVEAAHVRMFRRVVNDDGTTKWDYPGDPTKEPQNFGVETGLFFSNDMLSVLGPVS